MFTCEHCKETTPSIVIHKDELWCWTCHNEAKGESANKAPTVIGDDIPGGVEIRHGICNEDGSPRRYYSKSEIRRAAAAKGLTQHVEHVTDPKSGSDKSKHTTRWI